MGVINAMEKITSGNRINFYKFHTDDKDADTYIVSNAKEVDELRAITKDKSADEVSIFATTKDGKVLLTKQYRSSIGDYIYEFPSGSVEDNDVFTTAESIIKEVSGFDIEVYKSEYGLNNSFYPCVEMSDKTCAMISGIISGNIKTENNDEYKVFLADREDVIKMLKENNVCMKTALVLAYYIS